MKNVPVFSLCTLLCYRKLLCNFKDFFVIKYKPFITLLRLSVIYRTNETKTNERGIWGVPIRFLVPLARCPCATRYLNRDKTPASFYIIFLFETREYTKRIASILYQQLSLCASNSYWFSFAIIFSF